MTTYARALSDPEVEAAGAEWDAEMRRWAWNGRQWILWALPDSPVDRAAARLRLDEARQAYKRLLGIEEGESG